MGHQTFLQVDFSQWETLAIIFTRIAVYLLLDSLYRAVKGVNCYLQTWMKSFYKIDPLTDSEAESIVKQRQQLPQLNKYETDPYILQIFQSNTYLSLFDYFHVL